MHEGYSYSIPLTTQLCPGSLTTVTYYMYPHLITFTSCVDLVYTYSLEEDLVNVVEAYTTDPAWRATSQLFSQLYFGYIGQGGSAIPWAHIGPCPLNSKAYKTKD